MARLSALTDPLAVRKALSEYDRLGRAQFLRHYGFRPSRNYLLQEGTQSYDSKAIFGAAFGYQHGVPLKASDFSGGERTVKTILEKLGFSVVTRELISPAAFFIPNHVYHRQQDIHSTYGGQQQGGISTPSDLPVIFLFTGAGGGEFGYDDGWTSDGIYVYTGEGQVGDMQFTAGNAAIRDHGKNGKDILLFESLGKGKGQRFRGSFVCDSWEIVKRNDRTGRTRNAIVFHLAQVDVNLTDEAISQGLGGLPLDELRRRAYEASKPTAATRGAAARQYRERSAAVRDYVLARAKGKCEACRTPAPFVKQDGTPYLEPHHIRRLADDGPDDPRWVAGVCPTCHRRAHHGQDRVAVNERLLSVIRAKEGSLDA